jgi:HK97 family phage major capsid protein/HK97 family phage prohead protease
VEVKKKMVTGSFNRSAQFDRETIKEDDRTIELSISSETEEVTRRDGVEILGHNRDEIRTDRLDLGIPVLFNHDRDKHIGTLENWSIDSKDRKLRATVRFGKSDFADQKYNDVRDGILKDVSIGYNVYNATQQEREDTALDVYRVDDWQPLEVSFVTIPADISVGLGREEDHQEVKEEKKQIKVEETRQMSEEIKQETPKVDLKAIEKAAQERTHKRYSDIMALGKLNGAEDMARDFASDSTKTVSDFITKLNETADQRAADAPQLDKTIGLTEKEAQSFSITRGLKSILTGTFHRDGGFEKECSDALAKKFGREPQGFFVPEETLKAQSRDLSVAVNTAGGYTVSDDLLSGSFIDDLNNRMVVAGLGITRLSGLTGDITFPRQTSGATAYWIGEGTSVTETQQAFDQIKMTPKTVGALTEVTRKLILQSSIGIEAFIRADLAKRLAIAIDLAAFHGSGVAGQPRGIINVSGIGDVAGGTNGLAPTYAHIVDLEKAVAIDNALMGSLKYVTNSQIAAKLKTTQRFSSTDSPVWSTFGTTVSGEGILNGYQAIATNQVSRTLTKGTSDVASAIFFGNWSDLIMAEWGTLDVNVDTATNSATGAVRIVALKDVDLAVRHAESFAAMKDALGA